MKKNFCRRTRREFMWQAGGGFAGTALCGMLGPNFFANQALAANGADEWENPLAARLGHFQPKAKSVIFLFMYGGPSHIDTFDYKPKLVGMDNKTVKVKTFGRGGHKNEGRIVEPPWKFKQYGECGKWVSDLFPNVAKHVDDIAFVHSLTADSPIHGSAMLQMNSGEILSGSPCLGSWVNYGLGSENQNLPGFVVMLDKRGGPISGPKNWSSGYMPASYQATVMRSSGNPILDLKPNGMSKQTQRRLLDTLQEYNREHQANRSDNSNLAARIASYELAYKMQASAPEAVDLKQESAKTKELYGLNHPTASYFGRQCLMARRLVERGVRFIQVYSGGNHNDANWDAHGDLKVNHDLHAMETDQPIAALLSDLKQRGMLDETLVVWGGEFGRQPTAEYADARTGRDHNAYGFTMWMAGGGIKGGVSVGKTDELGASAVEDRFHVRRIHATILNQLGIDCNRLSYFFGGLDRKLVGVEGAEPIPQLIT